MGLFDFVMKNVYGVDSEDRGIFDEPSEPTGEVTAFEILGQRTHDVHAVGESNYQAALWRTAGGDQQSGPANRFQRFLLWPEPENPHDSDAISVRSVERTETLGYLSRGDAAKYKPAMNDAVRRGGIIICDGQITWSGSSGSFLGLVLDLPTVAETRRQIAAQ